MVKANMPMSGYTPWAHLRLPPFPQIALRVLQLANSENVQLHQLSELISSDPAFAGEVLTVANSLLYAPRFPVSSILQAIAVLGANNLQGLCLTVGVRSYLGKTLKLPAMQLVWRHDLACSLIASELASAGFLDREVAYTAGVLHDLGRLALGVIRPAEYGTLLSGFTGSPAEILEAEKLLFGIDHCEAGRHLIKEWKLSPELEPVAGSHHEGKSDNGTWNMGELIATSCLMADTLGYPAFPGCSTIPFEELLERLPARERRNFCPSADALAKEIEEKINSVESI